MQIDNLGSQDQGTTAQLDFEQPIVQLDKQIQELRDLGAAKGIDYSLQIRQLQQQRAAELKRIYANLTAWQVVQVARHPCRPIIKDYLDLIVRDLRQLHGDRRFGDDPAVITGLGQIGRHKVMIVGHNKGKSLREKIACNFGCAHPEGYRKALLKMQLAEKFGLPIITFIDTPGAYPGIGAEQRGQAQAIAENLFKMIQLRVPVVCICIGEGGSGGALGVGVGDRLAMLEFAYFSVISPEGCAAILWRDGAWAPQAAEALRLTSGDLLSLGLIDAVIPEPVGGAHRNPADTARNVERYIIRTLNELTSLPVEQLLAKRFERWRSRGTGFVAAGQDIVAVGPASASTAKTRAQLQL
ncbi:MAG: acetyl-CoA carboxylase carboxyltransferase subunit alpha [Sedimentisphaerales bacterium]|jgi:acetyl-CoA carboxylase carboxyl transferase subunit alpha|nr:acetyl-CoA carboxylase carboxyltransferase subunit alpha [Sedimentisphaerales bacterium]